MAVSKELETYSPSYVQALTELLDFVAEKNPHFGQHELRLVAQDFRDAEQASILAIEQAPLTEGKFKHNKLFRYAPFFNNFFIKYFTLPPNAATTQNVTHVLLERVIRQNSGAYNAAILSSLPKIDL